MVKVKVKAEMVKVKAGKTTTTLDPGGPPKKPRVALGEHGKYLVGLLQEGPDAGVVKVPVEQLDQLRRNAYTEAAASIAVPPAITAFADLMTRLHGPAVKIWRNVLPWVEALLVARYGEAVEHWPAEFDEFDAVRAQRWASGQDVPAGVSLLPKEK